MFTKLSKDKKKRLYFALHQVRLAYSVLALCIVPILVAVSVAELTVLTFGYNEDLYIVACMATFTLAFTVAMVFLYVVLED